MKTKMAAALNKAGVRQEEVEFQIAVAKFFNNGGTRSRAHEIIDAVPVAAEVAMSATPKALRRMKSLESPQPFSRPYQPRVLSKERQERRTKIAVILFGYRVADGRDLADVGAHEVDRMASDGALMQEIQKELPQLTGNMRFANLRDLLSVEQVAAARKRAGV